MDNLISFQRVIDRQDQTPVEGRFNYWNYTGDITTAWYTGILHRTRTRRKTTCLVGHPSIEATPAPAGMTTISQDTSQETDFASSLRIAPGHSGLHRSSRLPTTHINHRLLPWQDQPNGNPSTTPTLYPIWQPTGLFFHLVFPLPFLYTSVHSVVHANRCKANLATKLQWSLPVSWKYSLYFEFSLYSLFLQYTPNY